MSFQLINVGIAELHVTVHPNVLRTILGSCVGICIYDPKLKNIGMSHVMLSELNNPQGNPKKYANTAIPMLVEELKNSGSDVTSLVAKIIGGASMFNMGANSIMGDIGRKNVQKVKEVLQSYSIPIVAEDTGGDYGRTIDFFSSDGLVKVKSIGREEKTL
jgi:chemotaxis protein CheD